MIFKNINSEDISGLIICSEPPISSSAIRTKETTIDGRDGAIVEKLGYKTRIRNVEIGLKKDANVDKILSYFSGEGDLIFKNENDKVYKAAIYEQVDLERLLRLRKGSVAFYCQPFKYKRNDIFETIKDNKVKEKKGKHLELLNCAEQNVVDLKLEGSTTQATRSGKNFFDASKISNSNIIVSNNGKTITMPIVTSGNGYSSTSSTLQELCPNLNVGDTVYLFFKKSDENYNPYIYLNGSSFFWYRNTARTITQDDLRGVVGLYGNRYQDGQTEQIKIIDFIITKENNNEWEQYGASPSPDYPSPIENVEGKNIFDNKHPTAISQGAIWQPTETGGKYSTTVNWKKIEWRFKLDTSKTYTFHYKARNSSTLYLYIKTFTDNTYSTEKTSIIADGTATSKTFTPDTQYVLIKFDNSAVEADVLIEELQLEEGTVATPYVPYNSLEVKVEGKNKFDGEFEIAEYDSSGNKTTTTIWAVNKNIINVKPNTTYTVSQKETPTQYRIICFNDNEFLQWITSTQDLTNGYKSYTFTTPENCNKIYIQFRSTLELIATGTYVMTTDSITEAQLEEGELTQYEPYKSQVVTFPLGEEKLMEGSYLADDGIHHKRKQTVLGDITSLNSATILGVECQFAIYTFPDAKNTGRNYNFLSDRISPANETFGQYKGYRNGKQLLVLTTVDDTVEKFNSKISGSTVEYDLAEEEIVPYTAEQQEAYNQLQKLKLYKGQNTMFSLEGSIINLKYLEDTDEKVENQGNIYSKPIIRLEKTVFKEVEIAINGIRFKYNFEEDDYVEIDCEKMTVQYEGLDRNRRLVIDFEFPKLKEGNNDIIMYSGDCIIKCKRKDRWL